MYAPSPLAALVYGAVKVGGYAYAAHRLNRFVGANASPVAFGFAKTAIGFVGGLIYLFALADYFKGSDLLFYAGAAPFRLIAWTIALSLFYRLKPNILMLAVAAGTVWSYALDLLMWGIFKIMPGMVMPWC